MPAFEAMRGRCAEGRHARARGGRGKAKGGRAAAFQSYIERAGPDDRGRLADLVQDGDGTPVSFGTLGETAVERAAFWDALEARERADGRVQCRAIVELPHELSEPELARLSRDLVAPLAERGLPYHAAAHRPDVAGGSDPRNVHLHIVWSERSAERTGPGTWRFAAKKDREARGPAWVKSLRERSVATINKHLALADDGRRAAGLRGIAKRYDARSYREMGVEKLPGLHLGPGRTSLERAGVPTAAGVANAMREALWQEVDDAQREEARGRRALALILRPGVDGDAADRLADVIERRNRSGAPEPAERARRRAGFLRAAAVAPATTSRLVARKALAAAMLADTERATVELASADYAEPSNGDAFRAALAVARSARAQRAAEAAAEAAARRVDLTALERGTESPLDIAVREVERLRRRAMGAAAEVAAFQPLLDGGPAGQIASAGSCRRAAAAEERAAEARRASLAADALMAAVPASAPAAARLLVASALSRAVNGEAAAGGRKGIKARRHREIER